MCNSSLADTASMPGRTEVALLLLCEPQVPHIDTENGKAHE